MIPEQDKNPNPTPRPEDVLAGFLERVPDLADQLARLCAADPRGNLTVREAVDTYLKAGLARLGTRRREETPRFLYDLCRHLGPRRLADCKPLDLELWLAAHPEWKSDWTKRNVLATVQRAFNWCMRMGAIPENPFRGVSHPAGEAGQPVEDHVFRRLLRNSDPPFRRVLLFLRLTGARPGEMSSARWQDVDTERKVIVLAHHKTAHKIRKPRIIVLHPVVVRMIEWLRRHSCPGQERVVVNSLGNPWNHRSLACKFWRLRDKLRLPATVKLYGLRHGFATRAVRRGIGLKTVAELLGHTNTRMTEHYTHIAGNVEHLLDAAQQVTNPNHRKGA
jgi:integrase